MTKSFNFFTNCLLTNIVINRGKRQLTFYILHEVLKHTRVNSVA
jgi:hypothetical protein